MITAATEHKAVLDTLKALAKRQIAEVTVLPVDRARVPSARAAIGCSISDGSKPDIVASHMELTQSVQDGLNGLPMIAGAGDYGDRYPEPKQWTTAPTRIAEVDDLIICVRATIGDLNWADRRYCLGRGVGALRPHPGKLDVSYLAHYMTVAKAKLERFGTGSTFPAIRRGHLEDFPIPLPPLAEQKRIAAVRVEAGRDQEQLRAEAVERRQQDLVPGAAELGAAAARRQRRVGEVADAALVACAAARIQRRLVRGRVHHPRLVLEDRLGAVAVMDVEIGDRHARQAVRARLGISHEAIVFTAFGTVTPELIGTSILNDFYPSPAELIRDLQMTEDMDVKETKTDLMSAFKLPLINLPVNELIDRDQAVGVNQQPDEHGLLPPVPESDGAPVGRYLDLSQY